MPHNVYMYFHLTGSPSEPMNVQLQTLQMHNKLIYMISCHSKGLWFKKRVSTAVQFCFCDAAFIELGNRCNDTSKTSLGSNAVFTCDVCFLALLFVV